LIHVVQPERAAVVVAARRKTHPKAGLEAGTKAEAEATRAAKQKAVFMASNRILISRIVAHPLVSKGFALRLHYLAHQRQCRAIVSKQHALESNLFGIFLSLAQTRRLRRLQQNKAKHTELFDATSSNNCLASRV